MKFIQSFNKDMIEDVLRNKLLNNEGLSNLIGDRLFVLEASQAVTKPYVVYLVVSLVPQNTNSDHYDDIIIQYSVYAEKYSEARTIANLIRTDLDRYNGELEGLKISSIRFDSQGANEREKESRLAHISYDFRIVLNKS